MKFNTRLGANALAIGLTALTCVACSDGTATSAAPAQKVTASAPVSPDDAKKELERKGVTYSVEKYFDMAKSGQTPYVELFIKAGIDPNIRDNKSYSALHYAALEGQLGTVDFLLRSGADPNAKNDMTRTPLHLATLAKRTEVVKLLIEKGADVNAAEKDGATPLYFAADVQAAAIASLLVSRGANVNQKSAGGWAPLLLACDNGNVEITRLLLDHGADPNARVKLTPYWTATGKEIASSRGHQQVVSLFNSKGGK